jgi:hypothetical protein
MFLSVGSIETGDLVLLPEPGAAIGLSFGILGLRVSTAFDSLDVALSQHVISDRDLGITYQ